MMTAHDRRSKRGGILVERIIECPVCAQKAHSFRIAHVKELRTLEGEFYHARVTCAGSMVPGIAAAMDLLRLAVVGSLSFDFWRWTSTI
jgi:hypothetical protein